MTDMEWHSPSAEYLKSLTSHTDHIYGLTTLKDGTLVSCSKDRTIKFWDPNNLELLDTLNLY